VPEDRKTNLWLLCGLAVLGLAYAVYSSLPVLDPSSAMFSNDEGLFLHKGQRGVITADVRYGLFSLLVLSYFYLIDDLFWVLLLHKFLMLVAFLAFQKLLVANYGNAVYLLLFFTFTFLNGFFLRESLIFLFVLLAAHACCNRSIWGYASKIGLMLSRPQALLLFLPPWLSPVLLIGFLQFMRPDYAVLQKRDNGYLSIFSPFFWQDIGAFSLTTLSNINPLMSFKWYITRNDYLILCLLVIGSVPIFVVFWQMVLGLGLKQYRNIYFFRLWICMLGLLIMYGSIGLPIDKRIFIALFSPFIIFINTSLLRWRNLIWLIFTWIFMLVISMTFKLNF
jgi:hypothetical protein